MWRACVSFVAVVLSAGGCAPVDPAEFLEGVDTSDSQPPPGAGALDLETPRVRAKPQQVDGPSSITSPSALRGPNVVEVVDHTVSFACDESGNRHCIDDYLDLAAALTPTDLDMDGCIEDFVELSEAAIVGEPVLPAPYFDAISAHELGERVRDALSLGPLLSDIDERRLLVTEIAATDEQRRLVFTDGVAGSFEVRLLLPDGDGPWPAIIGAPGHPSGDEAIDDFVDLYWGRAYAAEGYLVAVVGFRGYDSGTSEHRATGELLCAGLSMTTMRAYEIQLVHKYLRRLRWRGQVDGVALVGHSEGATTGNVVARSDFRFDAYVSDNITAYLNVQPCSDDPAHRCMIGENTPALFTHHARINDLNLPVPPVPTLQQEYGYFDGPEVVLEFLAQHVSGGGL